ncbi:MAG: PAS domain S-box protein [Nitrospirae bacterium]|nr:PAS domain S-box protein [Nitrospirota bacterium]
MKLSSALRKRLAETLKEKDYLETILNGIKHRIILINREYKILHFNKAALGDRRDLIENNELYCYRIFENRDSICPDCPATTTFVTGEVVHIQRQYKNSSGDELSYKISSYPVMNRNGHVENAILAARDITEIYKAEQMKNDLLRMLTHDIRNPVLATAHTLETLLNCSSTQKKFETPVQEILCETRDNCELLLHLIDDVLDIYRHEGNKFRLNKREVEITGIIKSAVRLVQTLTKDKGIKTGLKLPKQVPPLIADENRIIRVLINLLENAVMFSPRNGKISITVSILPLMSGAVKKGNENEWDKNVPPILDTYLDRRGFLTPPQGFTNKLLPQIKISITDQGVGIPRNDLNKVFEKYYQVERKKAGSKIGLGLGLTYCRQIIEAHGGKIWAESPVYRGRGSRFVFTLPLQK